MATLIDNGGDSGDVVVDAVQMHVVLHDRLGQLPLLLALERGLVLLAIEFGLPLECLVVAAAVVVQQQENHYSRPRPTSRRPGFADEAGEELWQQRIPDRRLVRRERRA